MCSCVVPSLFLLGSLLAAMVAAAPAGPDGQPLEGAGSLDGSGSTAGGSVSSGGTVPYDLKSPENPHWNSFLNEVASQTSWTLADLTAKGASDPSIGLMWDVYVHSLGDGAALPGTSSSSGSGTSSSSTSSASTASVATNAELPNVNQNWFQSFFKNPADSTANSYSSQTQPQYDTGLSTNSFGGSSGGSAYSQFGSAPTSSGSMDQMFSRFRLPSSSTQTQTQTQYQQTQQYQSMPNSMALAQQFYSLVSPSLLQSFTPQQTQQTQQSVPQVRLPDAGWGMEQPQTSTAVTPPPLSDMAMQQLGDELLRLLGKSGTPPPPTPAPVPVTTPAPQPDQPRFDLTNFTNSLAQSLTQSLSQTQTQSQYQPPPVPVAQTQTQTNTQTQAGGQIPSPSQMPAGPMLGTDLLNMPSNNVQIPADFGAAGMGFPPGNLPFPNLPPRTPLDPMINLYNARFKAGASRDLGCRTLGEMLDMDVPRPLNLNCPQLCPAVLGRAMTGKRFGLTCLCCPVYVSDQAIGFRSMQRQAESLA